jgi:hypothetical protein
VCDRVDPYLLESGYSVEQIHERKSDVMLLRSVRTTLPWADTSQTLRSLSETEWTCIVPNLSGNDVNDTFSDVHKRFSKHVLRSCVSSQRLNVHVTKQRTLITL